MNKAEDPVDFSTDLGQSITNGQSHEKEIFYLPLRLIPTQENYHFSKGAIGSIIIE